MQVRKPATSIGLRLQAVVIGCTLTVLLAIATLRVSEFERERMESAARGELVGQVAAIKHRLESRLTVCSTVMRQALSFWLFSEKAPREEFRLYVNRLLKEESIFYAVALAGPDLTIEWVEPEYVRRGFAGVDFTQPGVISPDGGTAALKRHGNHMFVSDVRRLREAGRDGFYLVAPIVRGGNPEGSIVASILLQDLFSDLLSQQIGASHHLTIYDPRSQKILADSGARVGPDAVAQTAEVGILETSWLIELSREHIRGSVFRRPHVLVRSIGLIVAAVLGIMLAKLWLGRGRLRISEANLRKHAAELERANLQAEEAIAKLESANARLAAANVQLEEANTQLRDLNKELDDFNHVVSHDLKEPLRGIRAFSQFLLEDYGDRFDEMGQSYLENLMSAASRMQQLVNDVMQLSRISKSRSLRQVVDMEEVLRDAARDLSYSLQSRGAQLDIAPDLPSVWGDRTHLLIVAKNLLSNGLKYNNSPTPRVTIRWVDQGDMVLLEFKDNGIGVDPRFHKRIFELFERLVTQEEYEGTGAGLAITKKIIEQHEGTIWVESEPGRGSSFYFSLPKAD